MAMYPQPQKKKRPAPTAGPKQNTMKPRKSTARPGSRPGAKPPTAAQKAYAQQQTVKSGFRAAAARAKAGGPSLGKMKRPKPGTGTARPKNPNQPMPVRKPKPKTAKRKSPFAKGTPTQGGPRYTIMPVKGPKPKRPGMPVKQRPKTGGIAMSEKARKAMAFRKVEEAKKRAAYKRKAARPTGGPRRRAGIGRFR